MLTIHSVPELRAPTLVCAFSGWPDAGAAASGAVEYLIAKWGPRRFAEVDPHAVYIASEQRPRARLAPSGERRLRWPGMDFYALPVPHGPRDLVLLRGPEPDLRWRTCAHAILDLAEQLGTETVMTLGAFIGPVSHAGPVILSGRSSQPDLRGVLMELGLRDGSYQGPTGFPTALLDAASRRGMATASAWAASPIYLRSLRNPKLAAALLGVVERLFRVDIGLAELEVAGRDLERRVDEALRGRPDLARFVQRLTGLDSEADKVDEGERAGDEQSGGDLPDAAALLDDLERYLRDLRGGDTPDLG